MFSFTFLGRFGGSATSFSGLFQSSGLRPIRKRSCKKSKSVPGAARFHKFWGDGLDRQYCIRSHLGVYFEARRFHFLDFFNPQAYKETKLQEVEIGAGGGKVSQVLGGWFGEAALHSFTFWG